jgi:O-antigen/teichoic acid export membrane protein
MPDHGIRLFITFATGKALAVLLGVLTTVVVGRLLGPEGLGRWTLIAAAGTLLHTAFVNWTHPSMGRFGREEWVRSRSLSRTLSSRIPLLASSVAVALVLLILQPADWLQRWFGAPASEGWLVGLCALSVWLATEAQGTMQATDRFLLQAVLAPLIVAVSLIVLLTLAMFGAPSIVWTAVALTAAPIAGWGFAWVYSLARSNIQPRGPDLEDVLEQLQYGWPLLPGFAVGYVSAWGAHVLLTRLSMLDQVGLFGLSYQFVAALLTANSMATTFVLPWLIRRHVEDEGAIRRYVHSIAPTLYVLWMIGTVWLVAVLPGAVAQLTGSQFERSRSLLLIMLVAAPSSVVTSLYTVLFDIQGRLRRVAVYLVVTTAANLMVCLALIPRYGAAGAALGTTLSLTLGQALYIWDQHRRVGVPAGPVWALWGIGLALGAGQMLAGVSLGTRIVWAVVATAVLSAMVRRGALVDGGLVSRLFAGRFRPLATVINRVLVAGA